ncbi:chromatin assembly factor 1 subunit B [Pelomyxa schiedti]|nr:chromatin assembly factor 1 subunit B [Pelomyxa schiedti]
MRVKTLLVTWHDRQAVWSVDFSRVANIMATSGADNCVRLWQFDRESLTVTYLCSLGRHVRSVNVIRFSNNGTYLASAGDDGFIFIWKKDEQWSPPADSEDKECWKTIASFQAASAEFYDVSWSPDSQFIAAGATDNAVYIGGLKPNRWVDMKRDHTHFVQGVAWDPQNLLLASLGNDKTCRIYSRNGTTHKHHFTLKKNISSRGIARSSVITQAVTQENKPSKSDPNTVEHSPPPVPQIEANIVQLLPSSEGSASGKSTTTEKSLAEAQPINLPTNPPSTASTTASSAPSGLEDKSDSKYRQALFADESVILSFFRRLSWSPDGKLLCTPSAVYMDIQGATPSFSTYLFSRTSLKPLFHYPSPQFPSLVSRFNPRFFSKIENPYIPIHQYRMIFAIASRKAVSIFDTAHPHPLAVVENLHYADITDLSWSRDGYTLAISSADGFCSLIDFTVEDLGTLLPESEVPKFTNDAEGESEEGAATLSSGEQAKQGPNKKRKVEVANSSKETPINPLPTPVTSITNLIPTTTQAPASTQTTIPLPVSTPVPIPIPVSTPNPLPTHSNPTNSPSS